MNTTTATATIPAKFRKAIRVSQEISLRAGELINSITDGETITQADIRELSIVLITVNTKRKSIVDESTARFFFDAAHHIGQAVWALHAEDLAKVAEELDLAANEMDAVEAHVTGLFRR